MTPRAVAFGLTLGFLASWIGYDLIQALIAVTLFGNVACIALYLKKLMRNERC